MYQPVPLPFRRRQLADGAILAVSDSGDHAYLSVSEVELLQKEPSKLPLSLQADLKAKFFLASAGSRGHDRLLRSRVAERRAVTTQGPGLHIVVPTLQCGHTCQYCQVSRSLGSEGYTMSGEDLEKVCHSIFESKAPSLTVEFQGGDPLVQFGLVRRAIEKIANLNRDHCRSVRFVVATTLHQLTDEMCGFFREHSVYMSTSVDGPPHLHNRNRPVPTRDSFERTVAGIELARSCIGEHSVSALTTITRQSLRFPEEIVDQYIELGLNEIFLRPLALYGFAKRNVSSLGYTLDEYFDFYVRAFDRILYWNRHGHPIREVMASIWLNKMLSPFDAGFVDLQTPSGAGLGVLVYHYDGYVYPSDEARMLADMGDRSLRLGKIGDPLSALRNSELQRKFIEVSSSNSEPSCRECAYNRFCGKDPVGTYAEFHDLHARAETTTHCQRSMKLFDFLHSRLRNADSWFLDLTYAWAQPASAESGVDA